MVNVGRYSVHGSSWERINLPVPSELHFATSAGPTLFWSLEIHVLILPNWKKLLRRTLKGRLCPLFCWWTKNAVKYHGTWMLYDALLCGAYGARCDLRIHLLENRWHWSSRSGIGGWRCSVGWLIIFPSWRGWVWDVSVYQSNPPNFGWSCEYWSGNMIALWVTTIFLNFLQGATK